MGKHFTPRNMFVIFRNTGKEGSEREVDLIIERDPSVSCLQPNSEF